MHCRARICFVTVTVMAFSMARRMLPLFERFYYSDAECTIVDQCEGGTFSVCCEPHP